MRIAAPDRPPQNERNRPIGPVSFYVAGAVVRGKGLSIAQMRARPAVLTQALLGGLGIQRRQCTKRNQLISQGFTQGDVVELISKAGTDRRL